MSSGSKIVEIIFGILMDCGLSVEKVSNCGAMGLDFWARMCYSVCSESPQPAPALQCVTSTFQHLATLNVIQSSIFQ